MKRYFSILFAHLPWLLYVLLSDMFFIVLLWVADAKSLKTIALAVVLFSVLSFLFVCTLIRSSERKKTQALDDFLSNPDESHAQVLIANLKGSEKQRTESFCELITQREEKLNKEALRSEDYEEYVEAWAHEAKTPIALLTMILDNNRGNMEPEMAYKIEYIRSRLSESVDQMLQYSRLKSERKDYYFEELSLKEIISEVIEDYRPLLSEKNFLVINGVKEEKIYADRRALLYMLGQFVSNSIKYCSDEPTIDFRVEEIGKLIVEDNGIGVKKSDLPYIFERGFTGNTGSARKKATGMGLYLAAKIAEDMKFELNVSSETGKGFKIVVQYPNVEERNSREKQ